MKNTQNENEFIPSPALTKPGSTLLLTKKGPLISTIKRGDFSRVPLHEQLYEYDPSVREMAEDLFTALKIPPRTKTNVGRMLVAFTVQEAAALLAKHNLLNRKVIETRLHGMSLAYINGTYVEGWMDGIVFDWNAQMISGQKRLIALIMAGDRLHPKYGGYIWFVVQYGVDPSVREIMDVLQERDANNSVKFLANSKHNENLHSMLKVIHTFHSGLPAGTLRGNTDAMKRMFGMSKETLTWAASLKCTSGYCNTATGRLGLAELAMLNPDKADAAVRCLYHNKTNIPQLDALKVLVDNQAKHKKAPFGSSGGGSYEVNYYKYLVVFLSAYLHDREISSRQPEPAQLAAGWGTRQHELTAQYEAALAGPVPVIEIITDLTTITTNNTGTPHSNAVHAAQQGGCVNPSHAFSAIGLLSPGATYDVKVRTVIQNVVAWNDVLRKGGQIYRKQKDKQGVLQPSAIAAYLWRFSQVPGAFEFLDDEERLELIYCSIRPKLQSGKTKAPLRLTYAYLCVAFSAVNAGRSLPTFGEARSAMDRFLGDSQQ